MEPRPARILRKIEILRRAVEYGGVKRRESRFVFDHRSVDARSFGTVEQHVPDEFAVTRDEFRIGIAILHSV